MEVVGSAGQDRDDSLGGDIADEEGQEVAGRRIDPLDVLDDGQRRGIGPEPLQEAEKPLEQSGSVHGRRGVASVRGGSGLGQIRHQRRELRCRRAQEIPHPVARRDMGETAEGLHDREVREAVTAQVEARPMKDRRAGRFGPPDRLANEAALADAGLSPNEHEARPPGRGIFQGAVDPGHLPVAAHDDRAGATRHVADGTAAASRWKQPCSPIPGKQGLRERSGGCRRPLD